MVTLAVCKASAAFLALGITGTPSNTYLRGGNNLLPPMMLAPLPFLYIL